MTTRSKKRSAYSEKLLDQRWQKKRLELLEAAGWKCQRVPCYNENPNPTLHVHHKCYARNVDPWDYKDWVYVVLCDQCHKIEQETMQEMHVALAYNPELNALVQLLMEIPRDLAEVVCANVANLIPDENMASRFVMVMESLVEMNDVALERGMERGKSNSQPDNKKDSTQP